MQSSPPPPRRLSPGHETPAMFCHTDAPGIPLQNPWMDMATGDSFEHASLAQHPRAMENLQLKSAHAAFTAGRTHMGQQGALAALEQHISCPLTHEGMMQPVRAPDNMLYEAAALVKATRYSDLSPMTRQRFPETFTLTVDKRMQALSAACGTDIPEDKLVLTHLHVRMPRFATSLEAMEEGRTEEAPAPRAARWARGALYVAEGAITGLALRSMGVPDALSVLGGFAFFVGATLLHAEQAAPVWLPMATHL